MDMIDIDTRNRLLDFYHQNPILQKLCDRKDEAEPLKARV